MPVDSIQLGKYLSLIPECLTDDLLQAKRRLGKHHRPNALAGHCYVASEAIYHLMGGRKSGLKVYRCRLPDGDTHWWLQSESQIIDPTAAQFEETPSYHLGVRCSFLTKQPSRRAVQLIEMVQASLLRDEIQRVAEARFGKRHQ